MCLKDENRTSRKARFEVATETNINQKKAFFVLLYNPGSPTIPLSSCISQITLVPVFITTIAFH